MSLDGSRPLYIVFLWHMHQPYYRNSLTGECLLPWPRLHGLKNYFDIPAIGAAFPEIHQTFNLVPSLLAQVEAYTLHGQSDIFLEVAKKSPEALTRKERLFLLRNFFLANTDTMVNPYPRYRQLLEKRGLYGPLDDLDQTKEWYTLQDFRDLQVWFHLAWSGHTLRAMPEVQALFKKERNFTENEKKRLLDIHQEFLSGVIPQYQHLQETGQVEISTTPFYHPILPLLCDTNEAHVSLPEARLPSKNFAHPEDAKAQIQKSKAYYTERFGCAPRGMWPSEGSVSPAIIPFIAEAGIQWIATDDAILAHSLMDSSHPAPSVNDLTPTQRYRPYRLEDQSRSVHILFRDHMLSDRVGFVYARWNPEDAAKDLVARFLEIRQQTSDSGPAVVPIILDGENAWEYYSNHGYDFLHSLYTLLSNTPELQTVTVSEALEQVEALPLEYLYSGSWIGHNFATWIGHDEKNTGWECLEAARDQLVKFETKATTNQANQIENAWESLYMAEGSDWFWWYGDDHSSSNDEEFDQLFRTFVGNVYQYLDLAIPKRLLRPIRQPHIIQPTRQAVGPIKPDLDGRPTSYYEWLSAGYFDVRGGRGSMHQADTFLRRIYFGFDAFHLYLRIDTALPLTDKMCEGYRLGIHFQRPKPCNLVIISTDDTFELRIDDTIQNKQARMAVGAVIECAISFEYLEAGPLDILEFDQVVHQNGKELERWPHGSIVQLTVPDDSDTSNWLV